MKSVLRELEKESVGIYHLRRSCPAYVRVIEYDSLPRNLSKLFGRRYKAVILLYTMHDKGKQTDGTGHYVTLVKRENTIEYFSSYGFPIAMEIAATHSDPEKLQRLLPKNVLVNKTRLQRGYHTATCGRWAFARAVLANVPLKKFVSFFSGRLNLTSPDDIVSLATIFSIK